MQYQKTRRQKKGMLEPTDVKMLLKQTSTQLEKEKQKHKATKKKVEKNQEEHQQQINQKNKQVRDEKEYAATLTQKLDVVNHNIKNLHKENNQFISQTEQENEQYRNENE